MVFNRRLRHRDGVRGDQLTLDEAWYIGVNGHLIEFSATEDKIPEWGTLEPNKSGIWPTNAYRTKKKTNP